MRKHYAALLAGAGLLAIAGTAAADPLGFGFNISFGAPAPAYAAPPAHPYPQYAHSAPPALHARASDVHHGRRARAHDARHASRDESRQYGWGQRGHR